MTFVRLLAKSSANPDAPNGPETLPGHLVAVTRTALTIEEDWGHRYLESAGLDPQRFSVGLKVSFPRAAFLHDLGKASEQFQRMVRHSGSAQACWHEQLSIWLLLSFPELSHWLLEGCDENLRQQIRIAAIGHHLRLSDESDLGVRPASGSLVLTVLTSHRDFHGALQAGSGLLGLGPPPTLADATIDLLDPGPYEDVMGTWATDAADWWFQQPPEHRRFTALLKALVIAADVAGSAVSRRHADPADWTRQSLSRVCTPQELRHVAQVRLGNHQLRAFQVEAQDAATRVAFLRAGCGSGKTVAAYLWAARNAAGRKLFYCYPTTGTATQGFADYMPPSLAEARLVHSRALVDLEDVLTNGPGDGQDQIDALGKLGALASWDAPITVATVDTVLGLIQNNRRGLFTLPVIANGAFVFDEIHLYDDRLFGALLRFLEALPGAPILLMTASLPGGRLRAIEHTLLAAGEKLSLVEGPLELESIPRYRLERQERADAEASISGALQDGRRVLYVLNTVERAMDAADRARSHGLRPLSYHSRFRYADRLARHREVVRAFSPDSPGAALAVTTQVCEVSLDISADLLITELAAIPALIQRMGRLNRWVTDHGATPAPAVVVVPEAAAPYEQRELDRARQWVASLQARPLSQADLRAASEATAEAAEEPTPVHSAWLDEGLLSSLAPLREPGSSIPVLRQEDAETLKGLAGEARAKAIVRNTIPMLLGPVLREVSGWRRERGALIAPPGRIAYEPLSGARWS